MKVSGGIGPLGPDVPRDGVNDAPLVARRAEELGYDVVSSAETQHDSIIRSTLMITATSRIEVSTSVTIAFPRSPTVLAMEAWDLQILSGGRFSIGLGSQVKGHNERRFGIPWAPGPATRMKEYIRMMRAVWDSFQHGTAPSFKGKHYQFTLMTPNFNAGPIDHPMPKIGLACVGDAMARVAGEVADIVMPHGFMTDKYMREVLLPNVGVGLERSGRTWADIEVTGAGMTVFGEDQADIERNIDGLRPMVSFYGSTRSYHEVFDAHGLRDLGEQLHRLSLEGRWDEMRRVIPEEALWEMVETCTYDRIPEFLRTRREYASRVGVSVPLATPADRERLESILKEVRAIPPVAPTGLGG